MRRLSELQPGTFPDVNTKTYLDSGALDEQERVYATSGSVEVQELKITLRKVRTPGAAVSFGIEIDLKRENPALLKTLVNAIKQIDDYVSNEKNVINAHCNIDALKKLIVILQSFPALPSGQEVLPSVNVREAVEKSSKNESQLIPLVRFVGESIGQLASAAHAEIRKAKKALFASLMWKVVENRPISPIQPDGSMAETSGFSPLLHFKRRR